MPTTPKLDSYSLLGRTGLRVSPLSLGTMTFGTELGWGSDKETARRIFDAYAEAGGNFFDTADLYTGGTAEAWLGEFIAERGLRDKAVIATKFTYNAEAGNPNAGGNGRKNILRAVESSLKRLGTDYIDLYYLHTWDRMTPAEEVMRTFDDLVSSGKVRHVGLSDVPAWYASRAQTIAEFRGYEPVSALQLEYSLVERNIEREHTTLATEQDMGIAVWGPLANGLLSGKYRPSEDGGTGDGRLEMVKGSALAVFQKFTPRNWQIVSELEKVAGEMGHSMAQVAINWAAGRPGVATVIIGATRIGQLMDNMAALDFTIPEELAARLDAAGAPEKVFPYSFFENNQQERITGGVTVAAKPDGFHPRVEVVGTGTMVQPSASKAR